VRDPWFQAFFIEPPMMCGTRLLPFSVAHDYLLIHFDNPYAEADSAGTPEKLLEAVSICSRTWEQNRSGYMGTDQARFLRDIFRFSRRWGRRMNFAVADDSLRTYIADYRFVPEHEDHTPTENPVRIAAPLHWHLVRCLCTEYGRTVSQAWNTAYNEAKCLWDVWAESKGDDTLMSALDVRVNELSREADALHKAGRLEEAAAAWDKVQELCNLKARR
jgi:hypothetical protein